MDRTYNTPGLASGNACIGGMTASTPPREVAFSVLSEIQNITNDGINLAARIADALGGSSPSGSCNPKDVPMDLLSQLVNIRSSVIELNQQLNRTANALGV